MTPYINYDIGPKKIDNIPTNFNFYIDPNTGDDSNPGTKEFPKKSLLELLIDIWLNPDNYPDNISIFLFDGTHQLDGEITRQRGICNDGQKVFIFPLGKNIHILGNGPNTIISAKGGYSQHGKQTKGIISKYIDNTTAYTTKIENVVIKFWDMSQDSHAWSSPIANCGWNSGGYTPAGLLNLTLKNTTILSVDGRGLFETAGGFGGDRITLDNIYIAGLQNTLYSDGNESGITYPVVSGKYSKISSNEINEINSAKQTGDGLVQEDYGTTEEDFTNYVITHSNEYFDSYLNFAVGETFIENTRLFKADIVDEVKKIIFKLNKKSFNVDFHLAFCFKGKKSDGSVIYFVYDGAGNYTIISDLTSTNGYVVHNNGDLISGNTIEIPLQNFKTFLTNNNIEEFGIKVYFKNNKDNSGIYLDYVEYDVELHAAALMNDNSINEFLLKNQGIVFTYQVELNPETQQSTIKSTKITLLEI